MQDLVNRVKTVTPKDGGSLKEVLEFHYGPRVIAFCVLPITEGAAFEYICPCPLSVP